ncbi:MAG: lipase maturation factor family protein [Planctomycetota bacterium]
MPTRTRVRDLALRLLGVVYLIAFASLWVQLDVLMGSKGLLPAHEWLEVMPFRLTPSVFHATASDGALHAGAALGVVASIVLVLGLVPRVTLVVLWVLYLSFVSAGSRFFEFQWDTFLLEATLVGWFLAPLAWRLRGAPAPSTGATLLALGLVVKLHVESGLSKLISGDPTWRDLSALATYYETAPIPTPLAWWGHQLPPGVHQATAVLVLAIEIVAPLLVLGPHRVRGVLFFVFAALQVGTQLTANYGFFNVLTVVVCLLVLDDGHLAWFRRAAAADPVPAPHPIDRRLAGGALVAWAALSLVSFVSTESLEPVRLFFRPLRTVNAYHLFATMTIVRREVVIEGSLDGEKWEAYELRYKPGDPRRRPPFVAPHQPRVDFLLWFARLGNHDIRYLERLVARLLDEPEVVRELFAHMPFEGRAPRFVRIVTYQYGFTDAESVQETGAWWVRELLPRETSEVMSRQR